MGFVQHNRIYLRPLGYAYRSTFLTKKWHTVSGTPQACVADPGNLVRLRFWGTLDTFRRARFVLSPAHNNSGHVVLDGKA